MDCNAYREAISAHIDGEDGGLDAGILDAHLASCAPCRSWALAAVSATRLARVGLAEAVPDLSEAIMAAVPVPRKGRSRLRWRPAPASLVARAGLAMVAAAQAWLAVPALSGSDAGAPVHVAHEQGAWALALAVALLVVALRPVRASALLPFVAALAAGLAITMVLDIAGGRTQAAAEAPHGLAFLGLGMLWLLSRPAGAVVSGRRAGEPTRGMATAA